MKTRYILSAVLFLVLSLGTMLRAQTPVLISGQANIYTPEQLDELLAPIALYPDPLVALILPASTDSTDIVAAAQYFAANGDPAQVDNQQWDDSVKSLAHYPEIIQWMADNLDWTNAVGVAFVQQPSDVMKSIQQLRAQAIADGTLVNTPQQQVVMDGDIIRIVPTQPDVIYVPSYDPDVVFTDAPVVYTTPVIVFSQPCVVGPWLNFDCDWDDFGIWVGVWHPGWEYRREWRAQPGVVVTGRSWRADPVRQRELLRLAPQFRGDLPHARPRANAPVVANRPANGFHPASTPNSSRVDVRGWSGNNQRTASVAIRPVQSTPPARPQAAPETRPPERAPVAPEPRPTEKPPAERAPSNPTPEPNRPAPEVNRPAPEPNRPAPATPPSRPASAPVVSHPAPAAPAGPLFGGYDRGTTTRDESNRGQTSRVAAGIAPHPVTPAPAPHVEAPHVEAPPRAAPPEPPRAAPPPESRPAPSTPSSPGSPNQRRP